MKHFRKEAKPKEAGSAKRCLDCAYERQCPYSAKKSEHSPPSSYSIGAQYAVVYLEPVSQGSTGWPASTIVDGVPDIENVADVLQNGRYGECVYELDNDVCDNQVMDSVDSIGIQHSE